MSDPNNEDINKIFNEIISQNGSNKDSFLSEFSNKQIKQLLHVQESLAESLLNLNSIIYYMLTDESYTVPSSTAEFINPLYKISEDFISHLMELSDTMDEESETQDSTDEDNGE